MDRFLYQNENHDYENNGNLLSKLFLLVVDHVSRGLVEFHSKCLGMAPSMHYINREYFDQMHVFAEMLAENYQTVWLALDMVHLVVSNMKISILCIEIVLSIIQIRAM